MSAEKWTPGEWVAKQLGDSIYVGPPKPWAKSDVFEVVAVLEWSRDNHVKPTANAHLIAAAPALYDALRDLLDAVEDLGNVDAFLTPARAALALARGENVEAAK